eukprot:788516-Rhodomonas_salina.3
MTAPSRLTPLVVHAVSSSVAPRGTARKLLNTALNVPDAGSSYPTVRHPRQPEVWNVDCAHKSSTVLRCDPTSHRWSSSGKES